MRQIIHFFLITLVATAIGSSLCAQQNLVPNPSFELYDTCPNNGGQLYYAPPWNNPTLFASPDYFNSCGTSGYGTPNVLFGGETAYSGSAFAGIVSFVSCTLNPPACADYREYIQVQLNDTLVAGIKYCVRFYVSLADSSQLSANDVGVYFSDTLMTIYNDSVIDVIPQISNNPTLNPLTNKSGWIMVLDSFVATGGEQYLILGNFRYDNITDTTLQSGASWCPYAYYYVDEVLVAPCDSFNSTYDQAGGNGLKLYPNPTSRFIHIANISEDETEVVLLDALGHVLKRWNDCQVPEFTIDLSDYPNGIYWLSINSELTHVTAKVIKTP